MECSGLEMSGRRRLSRAAAFAVLVTVVALLAAGCGGHGNAKKSSSVSASASASASGSFNPVAYAQCMRANGLPNFPDPDKNGRMALPSDIDSNSAEFKKATEKCKQYMGSGGAPNLGANDLWSQDDKLKYARCMRENGVPSFPDPEADGMFPPFGQGVREVQARQRTTGRPGRRSRRRPGRWWVVSTQISLEGANPDRTGRHEPGSTSPQDGRRRLSKRGRRGRVIAVVVVVMVAAAGGAVYVRTDAFHAQPSATAASSGATTGLAQITKGNLAARSVQNGTLGYAGDHEVVNRASGTLTALPKVGDV